MSEVKVESDRYTRAVAETVKDAFTDPDFLFTMRFSSLHEAEEFDNSQVWARWHFLFETGISQMKQKVEELNRIKNDPKVTIPEDQLKNIQDLITQFSKYDESKPIDDPENLKIIRKHLRPYNYCLGYGAIMYDMHYSLLNGRYAEHEGQARKDVLDLTKAGIQRQHEVETSRQGHWYTPWNRGEKE